MWKKNDEKKRKKIEDIKENERVIFGIKKERGTFFFFRSFVIPHKLRIGSHTKSHTALFKVDL